MRTVLMTFALLALAAPSANAVEATFLGTATYATPADCKKVAKLQAGETRSLYSVPDTLTAKGYMGWEGGCTIEKITTKVPGKSWTVGLLCSEGAIENAKSQQTWTKARDGSLLVEGQGQKTRYVACVAPAKK